MLASQNAASQAVAKWYVLILCVCVDGWLTLFCCAGWVLSATVNKTSESKALVFCKLHVFQQVPGCSPIVYFCLKVFPDFSWKAFFCGKDLNPDCAILEDTPTQLTNARSVGNLLSYIDRAKPCQRTPTKHS